ncbi:hypothetical protein [Dyadobacter jejuensis]|uniref:hypothetical protein n=1 Tax=Dyadobacter jejuensis TaxID=1082580 RepID=UPI0011B1D1E6|nr:hypothetical protein [Dyadobacter jejuensis]
MGDLFIVHDLACGNWVDFHSIFFQLPKVLNADGGAIVAVPWRLLNIYQPMFVKHKLIYSNKGISEGIMNGDRKLSVLLFGNPDISPDIYNLGQPYVVAEKFIEKLNLVEIS